MTWFIQCDNCGAQDDWRLDGGRPFFPGGVVLQLRTENGGGRFTTAAELCEKCRDKLLAAFPALASTLREAGGIEK